MSNEIPSESPDHPDAIASDASLLQRYRKGDGEAATELYRKYAHRLFTLATHQASSKLKDRVDPEDIVQSVFRTFFRRVQGGEYQVPEGEEIWKLFLVIGLNKIRGLAKYHQAEKRDMRKTESGPTVDSAAEAISGEDQVALQALQMTIDEVLHPLPESFQKVVRLRLEGHEITEIAQRTGRARRSIERMLQQFREKLNGLIHGES